MYPLSRIILYGSRARDDAQKESDWDLLILVEKNLSEDDKMKIRYALFEIEWETNEVICSIIHSNSEWNDPVMQAMPFCQNIVREGIGI